MSQLSGRRLRAMQLANHLHMLSLDDRSSMISQAADMLLDMSLVNGDIANAARYRTIRDVREEMLEWYGTAESLDEYLDTLEGAE